MKKYTKGAAGIIYTCPKCREGYDTEEEALKCRDTTTDFLGISVGSLWVCPREFWWFDGSRDWVLNVPEDYILNHLYRYSNMSIIYMVSALREKAHKAECHLVTLGMTGDRGYRKMKTTAELLQTWKGLTNPKLSREAAHLIGQEATGYY